MNGRESESRRWWRQARRDLESARINAEHERFEVSCFLSQQSAEKALKALLYAQGESPVLGHAVVELVRRAREYGPALEGLDEPARNLDLLYIPSRYPNGLQDDLAPVDFFGSDEASGALDAAQRILDAVEPLLPETVQDAEI